MSMNKSDIEQIQRAVATSLHTGRGYCCNGSCGTSARVRALALSMEAGSGPRPSAKAASSARRPCRSPGRP